MSQATFKLSNTVSKLIAQVREIMVKFIANVLVYATPNPSMATLKTLTDNLEASEGAAMKGGTDKTKQMNLDKKLVKDNMAGLLGYTQSTSGGDAAKINLVANVKKQSSPKGLLPAPTDVRSIYGEHEGEILFRWKGVVGKSTYVMQFNDTPGDDTKWKEIGFTGKTNYNASGLVSGKMYSFRIATVSAAGISGWSNVSSHKAT